MSDKMPIHPDPMQTRFGPWPPGEKAESSFAAPDGWTAPHEIPSDMAKKIIAARDALTNMTGTDAIQEAYHQLYAIADPNFESINPWSILEAQSDKLRDAGESGVE